MARLFFYIKTYLIALLGVGVFHLLHLPLPWLLGPIFACLIAALLGMNFRSFGIIGNFMRSILGVAIGASITVALLTNMVSLIPSLLMVVAMLVVIGGVGVPYFQKIWRYDFVTAYYASMPGGLQDMLLFGEEAGANVRTLSLVHATRVLTIVTLLPIILFFLGEVDLSNPPGEPATSIPAMQFAVMLFASIFGWQIAKKMNMLGASILGPLILAGILSVTGILSHRPPAEAIWMAQYFLGIGIGVKYVGITMQEFRRDIVASLGFCVLLGIVTIGFFYGVSAISPASPINILLAFAPGGQAEMTVLALIIGADLSFVITHHILRILLVIIASPFVMRVANKFM